MEMTSRERMLAAINRQPVDRLPTDIWATGEVWLKLEAHFGGDAQTIKDALHIDGFGGTEPEYVGPPLPLLPEGESVNFWGIRHRLQEYNGGAYAEQCFWPLANVTSVDDLNAYDWPQTEWFDYSKMKDMAKAAHDTHAVNCGYMAPLYYHNMMRGLELSLMDPLLDPELTHEIVGRISNFFLAHHRKMFEACDGLIDLCQVTDDLGSQAGPLISLEVYKEFYAPHHKRMIDLAHEFGIKVMHHDDGSCRIFLPTLVDMGIDVLNPVQWMCPDMDMNELKAEFGDRIAFHGAIENQKILPFGTPEDVRAEVRHCIDALASDGTGYIVAPCHNLQVVSPVENIIAMYDEAYRYGRQGGAK